MKRPFPVKLPDTLTRENIRRFVDKMKIDKPALYVTAHIVCTHFLGSVHVFGTRHLQRAQSLLPTFTLPAPATEAN